MRAVVVERPGTPEVLRVIDLLEPRPGPGQVRVRVRAVGVQPFDTAVRRGELGELRDGQRLGQELAGTIDMVGAGVSAPAPGEDVIAFTKLQSLAELVVVPATHAVTKPQAMPWPEAAALSSSGQTALCALDELAVSPGEVVLVHGAAGGVGTMAVQLARRRGAAVIGTARAANHDHLRRLGAVAVRYGEGLAGRLRSAAPDGIDAALDTVGGDALRVSVDLVTDPDRVGTLLDFPLAAALGVRGIRASTSRGRLEQLVAAWSASQLEVHVRSVYPLGDVAAAHRDVEAGHGRGKVVVTLEPRAR